MGEDRGRPKYKESGIASSFIPYGYVNHRSSFEKNMASRYIYVPKKYANSKMVGSRIGERTCPGRFFARREIIAFCATIINDYDVELLTSEKSFKNGSIFYGLGTMRPLKRIPFRVRKRRIV